MKIRALGISTLIIASGISTANQAYAEQCLNQYADSAWNDGQPAGIKLDPSNLIITKFKIEASDAINQPLVEDIKFGQNGTTYDPQILYRLSLILHDFTVTGSKGSASLNLTSNFVAKVSLTYAGVGCSPRTVTLQKQVTLSNFIEDKTSHPAAEETMNKVLNPNKDKILTVSQKNNILSAWQFFISQLNATKANPIPVNPALPVESDPLATLNSNVLTKFGIAFYGGLVNDLQLDSTGRFSSHDDTMAMPLSISSDRCLTLSNRSTNSLNTAVLYEFGTNDAESTAHFIKPNSLCGLGVYFYDGQSTLVQVGTLWVKDASKTNAKIGTGSRTSSITCIKGKLSRKVNAINPTCPAGFKLKK